MTVDRRNWIPLIAAYQDLNTETETDIFICDLHFNQDDLIKNGVNMRLKQGACPQLR